MFLKHKPDVSKQGQPQPELQTIAYRRAGALRHCSIQSDAALEHLAQERGSAAEAGAEGAVPREGTK
eukprot:8951904-Pyramimonas_sp.AAC.1